MMIVPLAAAALLWFLLSRTPTFTRLVRGIHPGVPAKLLAIVLVVAALLTLAHGNVWAALCLFGVSLWSLGRGAPAPRRATTRADTSVIRSVLLEMEFHRPTGRLGGRVAAGPRKGTDLDALSRGECDALHAACLKVDRDGVGILEAYLNRRFPGWRAAGDGDGDPDTRRARFTSRMTEQEANQILGLRSGASRDEVVRSHRAAMKRWHPDQGGSVDLAARANEAKEVLLRRHA